MLQAIWGSLNAARKPHYPWDCLKCWHYLRSMRIPHIKEAATQLEAGSQKWGCLNIMRLPHFNKLPHKNEAASLHWGCLQTMRLANNRKATSIQWGCITTIWLPHNNEATSKTWLKTMRLPHNNIDTSQQLNYLIIELLHNNKGSGQVGAELPVWLSVWHGSCDSQSDASSF